PLTINSWVTVDYASPEHLDSGYVNEHDDFWAVGVMLYEMVSGHRPYSALDAIDDRRRSRLQRAIMNNAPREALPASCPTGLAAIINKLLAYQVDRRYPTAAAIKADLDAFVDGREPAAAQEYLAAPTMPIRPAPTGAAPASSGGIVVVPPTDPLPIATIARDSVAA